MFGWFKRLLPAAHSASDPITAILESDFALADSLRGLLTQKQIQEVIDTYQKLSDWLPKDIAVHMLQDCKPEMVREVMLDALKSPTVETRAIAYCSLAGDHFDAFVRNGAVDTHLVDRAITSYSSVLNNSGQIE